MPKKTKKTSTKKAEKKKVASKKKAAEGSSKESAKGGKKKKLLIVEDERPLAHALELKFSHEGFETHIAGDGAKGLELARKGKYHAILLDLIMPGVDGFAFLQEIKGKKTKTPIIVLTNLGQDEDRKRAQELGAAGYFVKSNTPIANIVKHVQSAI